MLFFFLMIRRPTGSTRTDTRLPYTTLVRAEADDREAVQALLERGGSLVVKPARGEQGRGVAVDLDTMESVETAITNASAHSDRVIVESFQDRKSTRLNSSH